MSSELNLLKGVHLDQAKVQKLLSSTSLLELVYQSFQLCLYLARQLVEQELARRSAEKTEWPDCPNCGSRIESKGCRSRELLTLIGVISWSRRVGRCSQRCAIGQIVPFDLELGISPYEKTMTSLKELGCLLAVFIPYGISSRIFEKLLGLPIGATTIWQWVQEYGNSAIEQLSKELDTYQSGDAIVPDAMSAEMLQLTCLMGADGVFAPFRPNGGDPRGKVVWKEIKVGVITRLKQRVNRQGERVTELVQRKLVAVLGDVSMIAQRLFLESHKQQIRQSSQVIWISDGGRWLWGIYQTYFESYAIGILDFYHAAQNLWKASVAWLDGRTSISKVWFNAARHDLRHGKTQKVFEELDQAIQDIQDQKKKNTTQNARNYLEIHLEHIQYQQFKQQELGIVISSPT
jgi:hypothetical protein